MRSVVNFVREQRGATGVVPDEQNKKRLGRAAGDLVRALVQDGAAIASSKHGTVSRGQ